jgi:hypothetical protein
MKCPHCLVEFHDNPVEINIGKDKDGDWQLVKRTCPKCLKFVMHLRLGTLAVFTRELTSWINEVSNKLVYPKSYSRSPVPSEVPKKFSIDYIEACTVLDNSPKASAALSRRCLQNILREIANVKKADLSKEIQETIDLGKLPSHIAESLDSIRNIGNFAAHPIKSQSSGEIFDVEPGEAEWNLNVLESLVDFYFVQPEIIKKKKAALNAKLSDAGRPQMK